MTNSNDPPNEADARWMRRALDLARLGLGWVEPNPLVGCVLVRDGAVVGEGYHERFGGPHAEVQALESAGGAAADSTAYVTLEPCCHHGQTPPCTEALLRAGIRRVVAAHRDPFPRVAGGGFARLRAAGVEVTDGVLAAEAEALNAPYLTLLRCGRPWVIAKWAMSLDGKIATRTGESQWISGPESRAAVHALRGRVDGILVGARTAAIDDPRLTARPAGARMATRVVLDSQARLSLDRQLVRTAGEVPTLVAVGPDAPLDRCRTLELAGCEVLQLESDDRSKRLRQLLDEFGRRRWTNLLVEGGGETLGSCFDAGFVDEVQIFIGPLVIGGGLAPGPVAGGGVERLVQASGWRVIRQVPCGADTQLVVRRTL